MIGTYLVPDLAAVDIALKELEEEDELALARIESTFQKSNTRTRPRQVSSNPPLEHADAVSSFVTKKEGWVLSENDVRRNSSDLSCSAYACFLD